MPSPGSESLRGRRVTVQALGCRTNLAEAEALASAFQRCGALIVDEPPYDAAVIVTCSVTVAADRKSRQLINRCRRAGENVCVAVCGCWAQGVGEKKAAAMGVDLLIGILKARRSAQYAVNALNALMRIGEETEDLRQKIGFALSEFAGIPQNPLTICCFGSSRPLNILNRMRILICARLDKWGIHHYVETVLNGGKLTQVERNMWRRLCR